MILVPRRSSHMLISHDRACMTRQLPNQQTDSGAHGLWRVVPCFSCALSAVCKRGRSLALGYSGHIMRKCPPHQPQEHWMVREEPTTHTTNKVVWRDRTCVKVLSRRFYCLDVTVTSSSSFTCTISGQPAWKRERALVAQRPRTSDTA